MKTNRSSKICHESYLLPLLSVSGKHSPRWLLLRSSRQRQNSVVSMKHFFFLEEINIIQYNFNNNNAKLCFSFSFSFILIYHRVFFFFYKYSHNCILCQSAIRAQLQPRDHYFCFFFSNFQREKSNF